MEEIYPIPDDDQLGEFTPEGDQLLEKLIEDAKGKTMNSLIRNVMDVLNESGEDVTFEFVEERIDDLNDIEVGELEVALQEGDYDTIVNLILD